MKARTLPAIAIATAFAFAVISMLAIVLCRDPAIAPGELPSALF